MQSRSTAGSSPTAETSDSEFEYDSSVHSGASCILEYLKALRAFF